MRIRGFVLVVGLCGYPMIANGQTISGKVTDALSGQPITSAKVGVTEARKSYLTDPEGRYAVDSLSRGTYTVRVESNGYLTQSKTVVLVGKGSVGASHITTDFSLYSVTTNAQALKGEMAVKYFFPGHAFVEITVADSAGRLVRKLFDRSRKGGSREFKWDGTNNLGEVVAAGTYTCKLVSGNLVTIRKLSWNGSSEKPKQ